ncbi:MAG: hypothetical protein EOO73_32600 [Myxococcales bacterium]|nr:MAG: hypothetical protein EOO73_32600 [Myxococcales bacterium]
MTGLEGVYAAPSSDETDDAFALDDEDGEDSVPPAVWYTVPLWRVWLFSLLGGALYQSYWMYRTWGAYRQSLGYSEHQRWRARQAANGFRVSAFWRAALFLYSYGLLVFVQREGRRAGVPGPGPAWLWFGLHVTALVVLPFGLNLLALSVVFLPAQLTVNRLHERSGGSPEREPVTAAEACWVAAGLLALWTVLNAQGVP